MTDSPGWVHIIWNYHTSGQLDTEVYTGSLLDGLSLDRDFDSQARLSSISALSASSALNQIGYSYDAASRLDTVTSGTNTATYAYVPNSPLVGSVTFKQGGVTRLTTTKVYDHLNRLSSISSAPSASSAVSAAYTYNSANQRTKATREDSAYWSYGYDALGQVTSGQKHLADATPVNGLDHVWTYDDIGNRKTAVTNGQTAIYSPTLLNQYASRSVPGAVDVFGAASATSTVSLTVNAGTPQAVTRQGELFSKQLAVNNTTSAATPSVKITGAKNNIGPNGEDAVTDVTRSVFVAQTPEAFVHDSDGNLTDDARWHYTWDGENRLSAMETSASAVTAGVPKQKLEFTYDGQGRRVSKKVFSWNLSLGTWNLDGSTLFLYDGWNMIAELNALGANSPVRTYVWGLDLSGSFQGAGGVDGLLFCTSSLVPSPSSFSPCYDGNGNIIAYVDLATGAKSATYEYSAFGETLIAEGVAHEQMPFRFSTKYTDSETSLLYYGLRYYNPSTGRWLSRDPIEEEGGANLFAFVGNSATNSFDPIGLLDGSTVPYGPATMMKRPNEGEVSGGVSGDVVLAAIKSVMTPKMSRGYKATTLLAALPGGSIELDLTFNGSVAPCACTRDGGAILQFTGEIIVEVRGGFGYILGNSNYQIRNPSNRPSHNNVYDGSKPGSGPITGIDGRKNNPTVSSGWKNKYSSSAIKECEDDWDLRVEIGAKFTAGAAIVGAQGILPFGGINRQGAYWSFKPSGSIQYGKSPVGVRAELYGQGVAAVKISF